MIGKTELDFNDFLDKLQFWTKNSSK